MPKEHTSNPETAKPATPAAKQEANQSTKDGLQKTRESTNDRAEVSKQKTSQGQSNRG